MLHFFIFVTEFFFLYFGFLSLDIHKSQDSRWVGRPILNSYFYRFYPLHRDSVISWVITLESSPELFLKASQNSQESTCARVSFLIKLQASACNFIKKETMAQVISCKFYKIFKNTFFQITPPVVASAHAKCSPEEKLISIIKFNVL